MAHNSARTLCIVEADLQHVKRTIHNDHWWNLGKRYELADFEVKIIPGSADLKFQLWNNGMLVNSPEDSIEVKWDAPTMAVGDIAHLDYPMGF